MEGDFEQCRSFSTSATSDTISPGLVLEGTKCGDEKVWPNKCSQSIAVYAFYVTCQLLTAKELFEAIVLIPLQNYCSFFLVHCTCTTEVDS